MVAKYSIIGQDVLFGLNESKIWSRARTLFCGQFLELGVQMTSLRMHRDVVDTSVVGFPLTQIVTQINLGTNFEGRSLISLNLTILAHRLSVKRLVLLVALSETDRCILLLKVLMSFCRR